MTTRPSNDHPLRIVVHNRQKRLSIKKRAIEKWAVPLLLSYLKVPFHEVSIHFIGKRAMARLHLRLFGDPSTTDCISLPLDDAESDLPYKVLGEVFVAPEIALEYALLHRKKPEEETALYIIHGLLHLLGFDDCDPHARRIMRREERRCLKTYDCLLS